MKEVAGKTFWRLMIYLVKRRVSLDGFNGIRVSRKKVEEIIGEELSGYENGYGGEDVDIINSDNKNEVITIEFLGGYTHDIFFM